MLLQSIEPYLPFHSSPLDLLGKWTTPLLMYKLVTAFSITLQGVVTLYYYNYIKAMSLLSVNARVRGKKLKITALISVEVSVRLIGVVLGLTKFDISAVKVPKKLAEVLLTVPMQV